MEHTHVNMQRCLYINVYIGEVNLPGFEVTGTQGQVKSAFIREDNSSRYSITKDRNAGC